MSLTVTYTHPITNKQIQVNNIRLTPTHILFAKMNDGSGFAFGPVYAEKDEERHTARFNELFGDRGELLKLDITVEGDPTYVPVDPIARLNARMEINKFFAELEDKYNSHHKSGTVITNPHTDETYTIGQRGRKPLWVKEYLETGSVAEPEVKATPVKAEAKKSPTEAANGTDEPKQLFKYHNAETGETYIAGLKRGRPPGWVMDLKRNPDYKPTPVLQMEA